MPGPQGELQGSLLLQSDAIQVVLNSTDEHTATEFVLISLQEILSLL